MGVGTSLEVSLHSADVPDSRVGQSVSSVDGPAFIAGLSDVPVESYEVVVSFSVFVAFDLSQRPLASTSFAMVGTVDVCH
jgi:hypothetical protein